MRISDLKCLRPSQTWGTQLRRKLARRRILKAQFQRVITLLSRAESKWGWAMSDSGSISIGNQTAFSAASLMEPFEYALANGFDAFEWFPDKKESGAGW